jgi:PTH1 family peptidyl-tRNA hydrolase
MKYLIAGLGNIGSEYANTRHNIGFKIVEALAAETGAAWKSERYGDVAEVRAKNKTLLLLKPNTYMNLSGKSIRYWMQQEKIPVENLLVVLDDLSLGFGRLRIKGKGSDGGHNGLKSIQELLGSTAYPRLRFGIGAEFHKGQQVDYVLGEWTAAESEGLPAAIKRSCDAVKSFALAGLERTMNQFNTKD